MTQVLDILPGIRPHIDAAMKLDGKPVTKSDAFHGDKLGSLDAAQCLEVIQYCRNEGCIAVFVESRYGRNLRIRKANR